MTDTELVELFFARSEKAIEETTKQYGGFCRGIAMGILNNQQDAEECLNDSLLKLWKSIPPARPRSMMAYFGSIARNRALEIYRKRRAKRRGAGEPSMVFEELAQCVGASDNDIAPDSLVIREALNKFLRGLSEEQRAIFLRRYWAAQSVEEIAKALHTGVGRVEGILHRLRERLRKKLKEEGIAV